MTQEEKDLALDEMAPATAGQVRAILKERDEAREVARDLWRNHLRERFWHTSVATWEAEHPWLKESDGSPDK